MNRERLESLAINDLRTLAARLKLDTKGSRTNIFDSLLNYYEREGWPPLPEQSSTESIREPRSDPSTMSSGSESHGEGQEMATFQPPCTIHTAGPSSGARQQNPPNIGSLPEIQFIVESVVRALQQASSSTSANVPPQNTSQTRELNETSSNVWQRVKFAEKLIPTFSGREDENVVRWMERISNIAQTYHFSNDVLLLAAISQLKDRALNWYNRQPLESVSVWEEFKFQVRRYFERKESYTATLARINTRFWRSHTEKFIDYAEEKLNLMQSLTLTEKEKIELLADGVKDFNLRRLVLNTWMDNVPDFIEHVRKITEDSIIMRKGESKYPKRKTGENTSSSEKTCFTCKKPGHLSKDCRIARATCFRCGQTGHLSNTCPKREASRSTTLNHVEQDTSLPTTSFSGTTSLSESVLPIGANSEAKLRVMIRRLRNNNNVAIPAMVDTGSPINLIKRSIHEKFFRDRDLLRVTKGNSYKGINESPLLVCGKIYDQIILENLNDLWFDITFLVVDDRTMRYDVIIGREFINNANLKFIFFQDEYAFEVVADCNKIAGDLLTINAIETKEPYDPIIENLDKDLKFQDRQSLLNTFIDVENAEIEKVDDNYRIQVYLKDNSLFRYAPRRMSIFERNELQKITDDLLERNIIRPSISPYCSRVILVTRRNGKKRMCIDLRPLNQRIYPQKYPFPIIEDQLDKLTNKRIFTKLDLKDEFHQIAIHPEHTKYFAFATPSGQYEFLRMPFGYSEAPAEFQKRVLQIFDPLLRDNKILIYIDDILIPTITVEENLKILKEVLIYLKKYDLELNLSKCLFLKKEIEYLGYLITANGITMSKRHIQAIIDFPQPRNVREIQSFLGLTNYFRKFIKDYALKVNCLQALVKKNVKFVFDGQCEQTFKRLKNELTSSPVLCIYNPLAETELHTDASSHGFGAILLQKQSNNCMAPVAFFSRATSDTEKNYHSYELETLAIVKAVERFHVYLQGINFKIVTDCNSLVLAMKKININPRIARWSLTLQNYKFTLIHRASGKMAHVDCLSRCIMNINLITIEDELMYKQLADPKIKEITEDLETRDNKYFILIEGLVFRKYADKNLFVVPENMINSVIRIYHDEMGHVGIDKTIHGLLSHYWFPCLKLRVKQYIENCVKCLSFSLIGGKPEGELEIFEKIAVPLHTLHIDHFGPLEVTADGYKYILVIVDAFTKFTWLFSTKSTTTDEVKKCLDILFDLFGLPERIISDRGTAFSSGNFAQFLNERKIKHVMNAVASPWANGQVERVNRFLKSTLSKISINSASWKNVLGNVQFIINNTLHKSINTTPSKVLLGYDQRQNFDNKLRELIDHLAQIDVDIERERTELRDSAQIVNRAVQEYNKTQYDKKHKKPTRYKEGDFILVKILQPKPGINQKLLPKYKGPYQIKTVLKKNRFVVTDIPGYNLTQKPFNTILSSDKIKPWIKINDNYPTDKNLI